MVSLDRLTKRFGAFMAVNGVSFALRRGEVLGFLGPNGAGKTTTMRMLAGFLSPTSGSARIMGHDVVTSPIEVKRRLGYLPEGSPLYGDMSVIAFLRFVAELRGLTRFAVLRRIAEAIDRTALDEVAHRPIETLSKGFRRRVGLAQAILHDPPVLVLDEPTDGLDPNQKHEVRRMINEMAPDKAIIISTHILEEVEAVCTRAIVIARGRIVADEGPAVLKQRSDWNRAVRLRVREDRSMSVRETVGHLPHVRDVRTLASTAGHRELLVVPREGATIIEEVREALGAADLTVEECVPEQGRLDDVFRDLTTGHA